MEHNVSVSVAVLQQHGLVSWLQWQCVLASYSCATGQCRAELKCVTVELFWLQSTFPAVYTASIILSCERLITIQLE